MKEIFKDISGYEGLYQVSSFGRVFSLRKNLIMKGDVTRTGYIQVPLCKNGCKVRYTIHRLVAQAFLPNPENKKTVNHINGIKTDNNLENLEWCTQSENARHSFRELGRKNWNVGIFGYRNKTSKVVLQLNNLGELIKEWGSMIDIERTLGIPHSNISSVCNGKKKSARGFIWKFKV